MSRWGNCVRQSSPRFPPANEKRLHHCLVEFIFEAGETESLVRLKQNKIAWQEELEAESQKTWESSVCFPSKPHAAAKKRREIQMNMTTVWSEVREGNTLLLFFSRFEVIIFVSRKRPFLRSRRHDYVSRELGLCACKPLRRLQTRMRLHSRD